MMEPLLKLAELLKGRDPFKYFKAPLSILFVCNITYLLYVVFYPSAPNLKTSGEISWVAYFLQAQYVVPFGLFVIVWVTTWLLGELMFQNTNWIITEKVRTWILNQSILTAFDTTGTPEQQNEIIAMAKAPKKNWVIHLYKHFTSSIPKEKMNQIKRAMQLTQTECSADFVLILRALFVLVIAFFKVSYLGKFLFIALFLFLICFALTLYFAYQLAAVIPIIGYKLGVEIEERESNKNENG